jgi:aspartyl/glutamyl-tRNA(Asn/Gln) amidotransferase C subunit
MTQITKEELLKLAQISQVQLYEDEIPALMRQIQDVLTYAERVQEIARDIEYDKVYKNQNIMRSDTIIKTDPEPLLALAPQQEEHYIVVPKIIESK